jgi:hypothetical protein
MMEKFRGFRMAELEFNRSATLLLRRGSLPPPLHVLLDPHVGLVSTENSHPHQVLRLLQGEVRMLLQEPTHLLVERLAGIVKICQLIIIHDKPPSIA